MSGSQAAFVNSMANYVIEHAPDVSRASLVLTGATEIRNMFTLDQQPIIISGYMDGIRVVFAICIAAAGVATLIGAASPWKKLNQAALTGGVA